MRITNLLFFMGDPCDLAGDEIVLLLHQLLAAIVDEGLARDDDRRRHNLQPGPSLVVLERVHEVEPCPQEDQVAYDAEKRHVARCVLRHCCFLRCRSWMAASISAPRIRSGISAAMKMSVSSRMCII